MEYRKLTFFCLFQWKCGGSAAFHVEYHTSPEIPLWPVGWLECHRCRHCRSCPFGTSAQSWVGSRSWSMGKLWRATVVEHHIYLLACALKAAESHNSLRLVQCYSDKVVWSTPVGARIQIKYSFTAILIHQCQLTTAKFLVPCYCFIWLAQFGQFYYAIAQVYYAKHMLKHN